MAGNLKNALFTTTDKINQGAKDAFNYVYAAGANGVVATVKAAESFVAGSVDIPFLVIPYQLIDPNNSPIRREEIAQ